MFGMLSHSSVPENNKLEAFHEEMKTSPSQLYQEVDVLKQKLSSDLLESECWKARQELAHLLESLLLINLDYALDKKVEQDLWSFVFRNPIAACQLKAKEQKNSSSVYSKSQLTTLLETASGFYLQLLQKLCCAYEIGLPCHPKNSVYGLSKEWVSRYYPVAHKPHKSSLFYICQHCLVHLGDIARYRGQSFQAENFYRHAVDLVPSNGQPYNQLALLEAASGEKLATVFFYMRSLAVQHPFPLARTNLQNLFSKMSSDGTCTEGKIRMSVFEYITVFLQFHAALHLNADVNKAKIMQSLLNTSLPALIIAEKFKTWQLVQMVAVCLFSSEQAWRSLDSEESDCYYYAQNSPRPEEPVAALLIEELLGSLLYAFLLPVHASSEPKETAAYYTLPAVKIIIDWLLQDPEFLQHKPLMRKPQIWHALCKLLNDLDVVSAESFDAKKFEDIPLPEDWDLQYFLPLKGSQKYLKFNLSAETPSDDESMWLRAVRVCKSGEVLSRKECLLSVSHKNGLRHFKPIHQTDKMSEQVFLQIQELSVTSSNPAVVLPNATEAPSHVINGSTPVVEHQQPVRLKSSPLEGLQQEVRFKLDDMQQKKDKPDLEDKLERHNKESLVFAGAGRRMGKNVAMQAILQQRAAQNASVINTMRSSEFVKEPSVLQPEMLMRQQPCPSNHVEVPHKIPEGKSMPAQIVQEMNLNRSQGHHFTQEQYKSIQGLPKPQQSVELTNALDRENSWTQSYNVHQHTIPNISPAVRGNALNNYMQNTVPHIIQSHQQPASDFNFHQVKSQQQPPHMISKSVTNQQPFLGNPPNIMWNYMNFMASYQEACGSHNSSSHPVVMQPNKESQHTNQMHIQAPSYYMANNGGHPKMPMIEPTLQQSVMSPYRGGSTSDVGVNQKNSIYQDKLQNEPSSHRLASNLWTPDPGSCTDLLPARYQLNQIGGRAVGGQGIQSSPAGQIRERANGSSTVTSSGHYDNGSSTYSLFSSPWPSGLNMPKTNKENQHRGSVDSVVMQSRIQSLWSGPGPSPLERLLEQQKQRRDNMPL